MRATNARMLPPALALLLAGACARNPAPTGWLRSAPEAQADPYGGWVVIRRRDGVSRVSGELLAVERDSVFILSVGGDVATVSLGEVLSAQVGFYDAQWRTMDLWTGIGAVSTLSHGLILVLSAPAWLLAGTIANATVSHGGLAKVDAGSDWREVQMYARYPRGLPPGLPRKLPVKPMQ